MTTDRTNEEGPAGTADAPGEASPQPEADAAGRGGAEEAPPAAAPMETELQSLRDRYLRLAAEYENFRKRTDRERAESWTRAQAQIVQQLLDPLDDLQRVAHFTEAASVKALLDGVQMVERKLARALEAAGLEVVDASGKPFDPLVHEALATGPAERREEDESVGEVFQKGYRFKGELLRPARVQVRKFEG